MMNKFLERQKAHGLLTERQVRILGGVALAGMLLVTGFVGGRATAPQARAPQGGDYPLVGIASCPRGERIVGGYAKAPDGTGTWLTLQPIDGHPEAARFTGNLPKFAAKVSIRIGCGALPDGNWQHADYTEFFDPSAVLFPELNCVDTPNTPGNNDTLIGTCTVDGLNPASTPSPTVSR